MRPSKQQVDILNEKDFYKILGVSRLQDADHTVLCFHDWTVVFHVRWLGTWHWIFSMIFTEPPRCLKVPKQMSRLPWAVFQSKDARKHHPALKTVYHSCTYTVTPITTYCRHIVVISSRFMQLPHLSSRRENDSYIDNYR